MRSSRSFTTGGRNAQPKQTRPSPTSLPTNAAEPYCPALGNSLSGTPIGRALLMTAAMTGMRRGELLGLRWGDVDGVQSRIWVRRSIGFGGVVKKPKTAKSVRAVSMPPVLAAELEAWWTQAYFRGDTDYVFASATGTPLDGRNMVRTIFEPARKAAGVGVVRFHDLRHSYASLLIAHGAHPKVISEQLGRASVQITMDRYSHLFGVSGELQRAWAASTAASIEPSNRSVPFRNAQDVVSEIPAIEAA